MLQKLASAISHKYKPRIILVAGILGRMGTREALYAILSEKYSVRRNLNDNSFDDLLYTILNSASGQKTLSEKITLFFRGLNLLLFRDKNYPQIIILSVPLHSEKIINQLYSNFLCDKVIITDKKLLEDSFIDLQKLSILIKHLASISKEEIIINGDDKDLLSYLPKKIEHTTVGFDDNNIIKADDIRYNYKIDKQLQSNILQGVSFKMSYEGNTVPLFIPDVLGELQILMALFAVACGLKEQLNILDISKSLLKYRSPRGLFYLVSGIKYSLIIDHTSGISAEAVAEGLQMMQDIQVDKPADKFIILGDIDGLGAETEDYHQTVGKHIASMGIDYLIVIGEKARDIQRGARSAGMEEHLVFSFETEAQAKKFVQNRIEQGDLLLIMGPKRLHLELLVKEIMANPQSSAEQLVRIKNKF